MVTLASNIGLITAFSVLQYGGTLAISALTCLLDRTIFFCHTLWPRVGFVAPIYLLQYLVFLIVIGGDAALSC